MSCPGFFLSLQGWLAEMEQFRCPAPALPFHSMALKTLPHPIVGVKVSALRSAKDRCCLGFFFLGWKGIFSFTSLCSPPHPALGLTQRHLIISVRYHFNSCALTPLTLLFYSHQGRQENYATAVLKHVYLRELLGESQEMNEGSREAMSIKSVCILHRETQLQ